VMLWKHLLLEAVFAVAKQAANDSGGALQAEADLLESCFGAHEAFEKQFQILASPQEAVDEWKQNKRKPVAEAADFLHDLYGGVYDKALEAMNMSECKDPSEVNWNTVKGLKPFEGIVRSFRSACSAVSCSAVDEAPVANKRTLHRMMSDPVYEDAHNDEVKKERDETWRKAAAERKAWVTFSVCKQWTKASLRQHLASLAAAKEFKGVIGEEHRILWGSCDLLAEDGGDNPWKDGVIHTDSMEIMAAAILDTNAATDTAVVFDGGSIKVRRKIEDQFDGAGWKNNRPAGIVYDQPENPRDEHGSVCSETTTWKQAASRLGLSPGSGC
jgi:hypothetical protein